MKWGRISLVIFGAIVITALGIDAADTLQGNTGTLLSQVISRDQGACPPGMAAVDTIGTLTCVDMYEASAGEECPVLAPEQIIGTQQNLETPACTAAPAEGQKPWRYVSRDQAMQMCARSGKRLPTSEEWYLLSLGMAGVEGSCNVSSRSVAGAGEHTACVSPAGIYDIVGNVWEWVSDDVINGMYNARQLPGSGYVTQVDAEGTAVLTAETADPLFGNDYFWSRDDGAYGMIRGGYYDSGTDAGIYTIHADTLPTAASAGVGFRCVK